MVSRLTENTGRFTRGMRLMLLGAILLVVGFCLPWLEVRIQPSPQEAMQTLQIPPPAPNAPSNFYLHGPGSASNIQGPFPVAVATVVYLIQRGGDLPYGLGWVILAFGLGAAVLPLLWDARRQGREMQRGVVLAALLAGSVILLYEITGATVASTFVAMGVGLFLVILGYAVVWTGAIREYMRPAPVPSARNITLVGSSLST